MTPTTVTFTVDVGQVWIDPDGVAWRVRFVDATAAHLERFVTDRRPLRDLVRGSRLCGDPYDKPCEP